MVQGQRRFRVWGEIDTPRKRNGEENVICRILEPLRNHASVNANILIMVYQNDQQEAQRLVARDGKCPPRACCGTSSPCFSLLS